MLFSEICKLLFVLKISQIVFVAVMISLGFLMWFSMADSNNNDRVNVGELSEVESGISVEEFQIPPEQVTVKDLHDAREEEVRGETEKRIDAMKVSLSPPPAYVLPIPDEDAYLPLSIRESLWKAFRRWGEEAGVDALLYALQMAPPGSDLRLDLAREAMLGWAEKEPFVVADYVATLSTPGQDFLLFSLPYALVSEDPKRSIDWSLNTVPAEHRGGAMQHTAIAILAENPENAYVWAESILVKEGAISVEERAGLNEVLLHSVRNDLDASKRMVEVLPSGDGKNVAAKTVLSFVADRSVEEAVAWAQSLIQSEGNKEGKFDDFVVSAALLFSDLSPEHSAFFEEAIRGGDSRQYYEDFKGLR